MLVQRSIPLVQRYKSTTASTTTTSVEQEIRRLSHLRNVGILAHVDAGKTTVTERMLALAGVVRRAGCVDDGNTVTDFLPAERERGITIQSAAVSFEWGWHNHYTGDDFDANDNVQVHLIDTPGHVDFSVEVNRSVAVLDGAVLVVDAVAGVQAQTETVWRAMTRPSLNNHDPTIPPSQLLLPGQDHAHEPLPCVALINKMDKEGCHFGNAIKSLQHKLPGANPVAIQLPLFANSAKTQQDSILGPTVGTIPNDELVSGDFIGVVDLVHMRAIVYPDVKDASIEENVPTVVPLLDPKTHAPIMEDCPVTRDALLGRKELIASLADVDEAMEEYFLLEEEPTNAEIRSALRRATLQRKALAVMAGAALKGRGIEPLLDSIADLLPSPLDRMPPALTSLQERSSRRRKPKKGGSSLEEEKKVTLGHPLHPNLLALAFKVVHMKGRGGSGDGRVVFARVYSGQIEDRTVLQIVSPPAPGETAEAPRIERVGGMLELTGGRFGNLQGGVCSSGDVCALIGLKSVVTGDTIVADRRGAKKKNNNNNNKNKNETNGSAVCLAGVASPKPVLTVRLEAETTEEQQRLSEALMLLAIEDPSLVVEETDSATLLSGLGELHIEVTLDRIHREFGLQVGTGKPAVAYRESLSEDVETDGLVVYDRTIGNTRLQGAVHLVLERTDNNNNDATSSCVLLSEPTVSIGLEARLQLGVDETKDENDLMVRNELVKALVLGCLGALKRGPLGNYPMANVHCHVLSIGAEGGLTALTDMPGALRAAAAHAVRTALDDSNVVLLLEPTMSVEVTFPSGLVGPVVSDLHNRRALVGQVSMTDNDEEHQKAFLQGEVPLAEILGYASSLRSLTGGEGAFTAEYKGHAPCDVSLLQTNVTNRR